MPLLNLSLSHAQSSNHVSRSFWVALSLSSRGSALGFGAAFLGFSVLGAGGSASVGSCVFLGVGLVVFGVAFFSTFFASVLAGSASCVTGSGSTIPVETKMRPSVTMRARPATSAAPMPANVAAILWCLAQVVSLFMVRLPNSLAGEGQSLERLALLVVVRLSGVFCVRNVCSGCFRTRAPRCSTIKRCRLRIGVLRGLWTHHSSP